MNFYDKATDIHDKVGMVDAHFDMPIEILKKRKAGESGIIKTKYLDEFKKANVKIIVMAVYIETELIPESAFRVAVEQIEALYADVAECEECVIAANQKELKAGLGAGKIVFLISLEGLEPINSSIYLLSALNRLGVSGAGLTWSRRNYVADGSRFNPMPEESPGGLSTFGRDVIKEMDKLGMLIDLSHINDEGAFDVLKVSNRPMVASHSNSRSVYNLQRNIPDEIAKEIAKRGGVIGLNGVRVLVCEKGITDDAIGALCDHADYYMKLIGPEHIGYGIDFAEYIFGSSPDKAGDTVPTYPEVLKITAELLRRGYSEKDVEGIVGGNFRRFFLNNLV